MSGWQESMVTTSNGASIQTKILHSDASRLAFIAHPYGRLGATWDDLVVTTLASQLHEKHKYSVVLMNSRGVGKSTGSPSFSALSEAEDYQSVVDHYMGTLASSRDSLTKTDVLICGYSAGSLSASCCEPPPAADARYLLISYPVSAIWALTLFRSATFAAAQDRIAGNASTPLFTVRGTRDQFVGSASFEKWEAGLKGKGGNVTCATIVGADHFWRQPGHLTRMMREVDAWLEDTHR